MKKLSFLFILLAVAFSLAAQPLSDSIEKTFQNKSHVEVDGIFCNVNITGSDQSEITLKGEVYSSQKINIKVSENGPVLKIYLEKPSMLSGSHKGTLQLTVPQNTHLSITTASGSQTIQKMGKAEYLFTSASGSIHIEEVGSGIEAKTSSGSIKATGVKGNVKANTASGSQTLTNITGDLDAKSASGSIFGEKITGFVRAIAASGDIELTGLGLGVSAKCASGSIKIAQINGEVTANTASGNIKLIGVSGKLNLQSVSGSQQGENITLTESSAFQSVSGSISMKLNNSDEQLSFDLEAVSGGLNAKGISAKKQLKSGSGNVVVKGVSVSGSQSYN